jgi:hypothetical protein
MKIGKIIISALVTLCAFATTAEANNSPYQFLRYVSSARGAALAGAFTSVANDPSALVYNPATIYTVENKPLSTTFLKHVLDINSGLVTYVHPLDDGAKVAGAISYTNYGSFTGADKFGNLTSDFGGHDISAAVYYSDWIDSSLYYGAGAKFIFVNLEQESFLAMAIDAGILYELNERSNIGISILHAGMQLSGIEGVDESLPLDVRAGINHRLRGLPLLVNFSFHHLADNEGDFFSKFRNFAIGGELYLGEAIRVRLGYDNQVRNYVSLDSDKGLSGFTAGVGIILENFNIDYGAAQYGSASTLHRFSIGMNIPD